MNLRTLKGMFLSKFKKTQQREEMSQIIYSKIKMASETLSNEKNMIEEMKHLFVHFVSYFFEKSIKLDFFILFKLVFFWLFLIYFHRTIIDILPNFPSNMIHIKRETFFNILEKKNIQELKLFF